MAPSTVRRSPALYDTQNSQASSSLSSLASQADIPSNSDLAQLVSSLRERRSLLVRRRRNLKSDESNVLLGKIADNGVREESLATILDKLEEQVSTKLTSVSPLTKKVPLAPFIPGKGRAGQAPSPSPGVVQPSPSPASSSVGQAAIAAQSAAPTRTKFKIKRDPDRERERSESVVELGSTPAAASTNGGGGSSRQGGEASPSFEADWEEEAPSRPARTYQSKRKRQRNSQTRDQDDISQQSEVGSPAPTFSQRASPQRETSWSGKPPGTGLYGSGSGSIQPTIKLKLNPTTHTAPMRTDTLNTAIRRPSTFRGREDLVAVPMTPMQASQAAMWELPKRTSDTFIPKPPTSKPPRTYATRPDEVDVDFAKMDWRERDKERDRLEAAAAAAASINGGPGPGQAVIKEGTAASRARDRKQDQVAHHIFQQWTDGWFRTLTEEDLAWFSSKPEELDAFQFPSLGRHYSEVWEEEEANGVVIPTTYLPTALGITTSSTTVPVPINGSLIRTGAGGVATGMNGRVPSINRPSSSSTNGETPKFDPRNLKDDHLYGGSSDDVRSGPFTERLIAALLPIPPRANTTSDSAVPINGDSNGTSNNQTNSTLTNGHHPPAVPALSASRPQDMAEYEERLRRELKAIDVLGDEEVDWFDRADDEVSSTLRTVQRLLRKQIRVNELRKSRLFQIAMERMAYQDYLGCLNSVEREIESGWMKRQTQIRKSMQAQKKKKGGSNSQNSGNAVKNIAAAVNAEGQNVSSPATPAGVIGATGMAHSSSSIGANHTTSDRGGGPIPPQFSDSLLSAMEKRKQLKFAFEPLFVDKPFAKYTPKADESIYQDVDFSS